MLTAIEVDHQHCGHRDRRKNQRKKYVANNANAGDISAETNTIAAWELSHVTNQRDINDRTYAKDV